MGMEQRYETAFPGAFSNVTIANYGSLNFKITDPDELFQKIQRMEVSCDSEFSRITKDSLYWVIANFISLP